MPRDWMDENDELSGAVWLKNPSRKPHQPYRVLIPNATIRKDGFISLNLQAYILFGTPPALRVGYNGRSILLQGCESNTSNSSDILVVRRTSDSPERYLADIRYPLNQAGIDYSNALIFLNVTRVGNILVLPLDQARKRLYQPFTRAKKSKDLYVTSSLLLRDEEDVSKVSEPLANIVDQQIFYHGQLLYG